MVTGEMASLRKSLDQDFEKQRASLLSAFNEQLNRALKTPSREKSVEPCPEDRVDLRTELDRHRRQLDEELKRHLSDSVVDLKNELTMTLKEQEKELLKLMVKSKTGNDVPNRYGQIQFHKCYVYGIPVHNGSGRRCSCLKNSA